MRRAGFAFAEPLRLWAVSSPGIAAQALGLAEALARMTPTNITAKTVALRSPYAWFPPGFTPAPRHALSDASDPIEPPWPDVFIGCGRSTVPIAMAMRRWSQGRTLVVQLQDPRVNPREFDLVIPPTHDGLEGPNVFPTIGACHRVTPEKIAEALAQFPQALEEHAAPRLAVLIGGKSKRQDISGERARRIAESLVEAKEQTGGALLVTLSRRTGAAARAQFRARLSPHAALFYEGEGPNPYFAMLGAADAIIVTADSVNMAAEAASTGKPIHVLEVDGAPGKLARFHASLAARGAARAFTLPLQHWRPAPLMETERIAGVIATVLQERMGAS